MHGFMPGRWHLKRLGMAVCAALWSTASFQIVHAQAPPPGALPITALTGGPVSAPSTDPRNLEGIWAPAGGMLGSGGIPQDARPGESPSAVAFALTMHPQAAATAERLRLLSANSTPVATPHSTCRPTGVAGITSLKFPVVIVQTPEKLVFLMEEDRDVYQVFLNRGHQTQLPPSYNGDSVAHWEGNTLVVDTVGYNGWGFIDESWHPNSEKTHLVQRFIKSADGRTLDIETILHDPKNYTAASQMHQQWTWASGTRQAENDCSEEPIDASVHFVYENERFRPVCSVVATGEDSKVICERPKRAAQPPQK